MFGDGFRCEEGQKRRPGSIHGVVRAPVEGGAGAGADSKSGGAFGRLEYSRTNSMFGVRISKRGTKDA